MLNRAVLIGRLVKDSELKYTQNGKAVATFTLAVGRKSKNDATDFIPIVVWEKQAENIATYTKKGSLVALEGKIQTRNYEKNGKKIYITEVLADNVRFLDSKKNDTESSSFDNSPIDINDDDLPF